MTAQRREDKRVRHGDSFAFAAAVAPLSFQQSYFDTSWRRCDLRVRERERHNDGGSGIEGESGGQAAFEPLSTTRTWWLRVLFSGYRSMRHQARMR